MVTYYKVLDSDGGCCHGGYGKWYLPEDGKPGQWMPAVEGEVKCCENGYHLVTASQLLSWLGPTIWVAEGRGDCDVDDDKTAFREARLISRVETWNERTVRLFICDCAEHVLPLYKCRHGDAAVLQASIDAGRKYANGKMTLKQLKKAHAKLLPLMYRIYPHLFDKFVVDAAYMASSYVEQSMQSLVSLADDAAYKAYEVYGVGKDTYVSEKAAAEEAWQAGRLCELLGIEQDDITER